MLLLIASGTRAPAADTSSTDWLRGSGKNLELCLQGEVLDSDGKSATDFQLTCTMDCNITKQPVKPTLDGHRFKIWIPVNQPDWYSVSIDATKARNARVAHQFFDKFQLRQAAIDGVKLTLQTPTRHFSVKLTDQGQPVSGATVKADFSFGGELRATTDDTGIAHFRHLRQQELIRLTTWTDDHRIGGFSFSGSPLRDPDADEHLIELSKCRDQKIRCVAEDGSPVAGFDFGIQVTTRFSDFNIGAPTSKSNFIGGNEHFHFTSDAQGEAVCKWFPDWENAHTHFTINQNRWFIASDPKPIDGVEVVSLKKSTPRQHVAGRVVPAGINIGAGGVYVSLRSYSGEREGYGEAISTFTDPDGTFAIDVLPDATYCAFVLDNRWVGKMIDILPYESASKKTTSPELMISEGQPVEVTVTTGSTNQPIPNQPISFRRYYEYSWQVNGKTRSGMDTAQWFGITDESGKVVTRALPGQVEISLYTPRWKDGETITVAKGQPAVVTLHRDIGEKRTVTGRLVLDDGVWASLKDALIRIASTDANYEDQQSPVCNADGTFSFDTFAASISLFARTDDGLAAATLMTKDLSSPLEVHLQPTSNYEGRLLDKSKHPVVGATIVAQVTLEAEKNRNATAPRSFEATEIKTTTDAEGNYTLRGIPSRMNISLYVETADPAARSIPLGKVFLDPTKSPAREVSIVQKAASTLVKPATEPAKPR